MKLDPRETLVLAKLYLNGSFPKMVLTQTEAIKIMGVSKPTGIKILKGLEKKGLIDSHRCYVTSYTPKKDYNIRKKIAKIVGI